jgi:hypothetical protein
MRRWADAVNDGGDPLMFLEAIPNPMIAGYVRSALVRAWDYAAAMHLPAGSLDALEMSAYPRLELARPHAGNGATRAVCPQIFAGR